MERPGKSNIKILVIETSLGERIKNIFLKRSVNGRRWLQRPRIWNKPKKTFPLLLPIPVHLEMGVNFKSCIIATLNFPAQLWIRTSSSGRQNIDSVYIFFFDLCHFNSLIFVFFIAWLSSEVQCSLPHFYSAWMQLYLWLFPGFEWQWPCLQKSPLPLSHWHLCKYTGSEVFLLCFPSIISLIAGFH